MALKSDWNSLINHHTLPTFLTSGAIRSNSHGHGFKDEVGLMHLFLNLFFLLLKKEYCQHKIVSKSYSIWIFRYVSLCGRMALFLPLKNHTKNRISTNVWKGNWCFRTKKKKRIQPPPSSSSHLKGSILYRFPMCSKFFLMHFRKKGTYHERYCNFKSALTHIQLVQIQLEKIHSNQQNSNWIHSSIFALGGDHFSNCRQMI